MSRDKLARRSAKYVSWLLIALATGGAWVFYFADAPTLASSLLAFDAPPIAYTTIAILTATTYVFGGFMREQVCTYMCPWPHIQAAMLDGQSLTVTYNDWRGEPRTPVQCSEGDLWFGTEGGEMSALRVHADLRAGSMAVMAAFDKAGLPRRLLSGDSASSVSGVAARLGFDPARIASRMSPAGKADRIDSLATDGGPVLFVDDGINDAPAMGKAHVSITPADASEIGRSNADFVFTGQSLDGVLSAFTVSHEVIACVRQNFVIAIAYNALAVPLAMAGFVTPLLAAVAMSTSSLIVVANALRLRYPMLQGQRAATPAPAPLTLGLSPR